MPDAITSDEFSSLIDSEELERFVDVPEWSIKQVRLVKLDPNGFLEMINFQAGIEKHPEGHQDAGKIVHNSDAVKFAAMLLSKTIRDENDGLPFDSDKGRLYLTRCHPDIQSRLVNEAIDLCDLGPGQLDAKIEASKKNK